MTEENNGNRKRLESEESILKRGGEGGKQHFIVTFHWWVAWGSVVIRPTPFIFICRWRLMLKSKGGGREDRG